MVDFLVVVCVTAKDKDKVVDILAKHCDDKSKLQQLKDKYKEKHDQVGSWLMYQYFLVFHL